MSLRDLRMATAREVACPPACSRFPAPAFKPHSAVKIKLVCLNPLASPREITLDQFPIELGRGIGAGVRIDDRWLSRRHCRLTEVAGTIHVSDLQSRHGTLINGRPVTESPLQPGDELCIGLSHFTAVYEPETRSASETPHVHDSGELAMA